MLGGLIDRFEVSKAYMNELRKQVEECELGNDNKRVLGQIDEVVSKLN
jgi:hypothetical protein